MTSEKKKKKKKHRKEIYENEGSGTVALRKTQSVSTWPVNGREDGVADSSFKGEPFVVKSFIRDHRKFTHKGDSPPC